MEEKKSTEIPKVMVSEIGKGDKKFLKNEQFEINGFLWNSVRLVL